MSAWWRAPMVAVKHQLVTRPELKYALKRGRYRSLRPAAWLLGPGLTPEVRILGYHTVGDGCNNLSVSTAQFARQLDWLARNQFRVVTLQEWQRQAQAGQVAPRTVVLTFDDGYRNVLHRAAPLLAERGMAATVFVLTDLAGQTNAFDQFLHAPELPLLTWDEVEQLKRLGWDVQSHGRRHYPMARLVQSVLEDEIGGSKAELERRLGQDVRFFCYPYGAYDASAVRAVEQAGYAGAITCGTGRVPVGREGDWFRLSRTLIDGMMGMADFASLFRSGYLRLSALDRWARRCAGEDSSEHLFDYADRLQHLGVFRHRTVSA